MTNKFAVKAKCFSLYEAFKKEAEKIGWDYNQAFSEFESERMDFCNCLWFAATWDKDNDFLFSFSNAGFSSHAFELPKQWDEAIDYMGKLFELGKPKGKLTISIKNLADHHGVDVDDIVITA
jgi:hypothetical protein